MTFCFVHAADLHLDTPFSGIRGVDQRVGEALREASLQAFDALVDLAIERDAAFVLFAGDIYDGPDRGVRAQIRFRNGLERLGEKGIRSFVVHGNHDPVAKGWSAIGNVWPELVKVFEPGKVDRVVVEKNGQPIATVHGISYRQEKETENLAALFDAGDSPGLRVAMLHCNVGGLPGHASYAPCSEKDLLRSGFDYWALGHVHQKQTLRDGNPWIVYPGNTQGRDPGELGPKGALVVSAGGRTVSEPEFVPLDVVRFERIDLDISPYTDLASLQRALADGAQSLAASADGRSVLVRGVLTGRGSIHRDLMHEKRLEELLQSLRDDAGEGEPFIWWEDLRDETRSEVDLDALRKGKDFAAELLAAADELLTDETAREDFARQALAALPAGALEGMGVEVPSGADPGRLQDAASMALDLLAGDE